MENLKNCAFVKKISLSFPERAISRRRRSCQTSYSVSVGTEIFKWKLSKMAWKKENCVVSTESRFDSTRILCFGTQKNLLYRTKYCELLYHQEYQKQCFEKDFERVSLIGESILNKMCNIRKWNLLFGIKFVRPEL